MGYFSNGTEGELYQSQYCDRCLYDNPAKGIYCPIWNLHMLDNYKECNKPESYLHALIPRSKTDHDNERCRMFVDRNAIPSLSVEKIESDTLGNPVV